MAKKIIRLSRTKEQKQANRERNERANRTILSRTLILMILCGVIAFVPLIGTLYHLMITEHDYYNEKAIKNQTRSTNLTAARGVIYDANMNVLASSSTVETVFIDPNEIAEQMKKPENSNLLDQIARGLGEILDVEPSFVYEQAADKQYRYKVISRKISEELADEVRAFISENKITGVYLETDLKRYYPNSSLAAQALGFVSSDNNGSEGLEAYYNEELSGTAGKVVTSKGNYGSEMLYTYEKYYDASDGCSLVTTIDATVQAYVEKNLQNAIDKYDIKNGAFCIVMDVNTGEIKAMATLGSYDPNNYLEIYDDAAAALLENERDAALSLPETSDAYKAAIEQYKQDAADLVFFLDDTKSAAPDDEAERYRIRRKYWEKAIPMIQAATGSFKNVSPQKNNTIMGGTNKPGVSVSCIANFDSARVEIYIDVGNYDRNRKLFSIFENHRLEIETAYGKSLTWVSQDGVRACRIYDKLEGVSITNEEDWDAMVSFHANKAKALLTIVQPFLT